ncbi:hypothetical protein N7453_011945 [Penicillium expansum]|nr:hypothetical protein N7453_011945 [Penicillium expansum]
MPGSQDEPVAGMEASSIPGSASSSPMSISSTSSTRDIQQPLSIPASHMPNSRGDTVSEMSASSLSMSISSTSSTPDIQQPPSMPAFGITPPWRRANQVTPPWRRMNQVNATDGGPSASSSGQQSQQHFPGPLLIGQAL